MVLIIFWVAFKAEQHKVLLAQGFCLVRAHKRDSFGLRHQNRSRRHFRPQPSRLHRSQVFAACHLGVWLGGVDRLTGLLAG